MNNGSEISPREFLRNRRPEQFTDSTSDDVAVLDRAFLDYYISTLTSRSQEVAFENFARKLAERQICPNLLPHTGPTGGGDSKVDSETFPVADLLTLTWYTGIGIQASSERWGFAFSAKKEWQGKVRDDMRKAVSTDRGYRKLFFVSSQYIPDRERAKFEDELTRELGVDVRIFDKQWILDQVYLNRLEALAVEQLQIPVSIKPTRKIGPQDVQREAELEEIEKGISEGVQSTEQRFKLVEDSIRAAILSRGLDRPRIETDGRFARAERIAEKFGTPGQRLECVYEKARTAFWWYEDYLGLSDIYKKAEDLAGGSKNPHDLERLRCLWFLLHCAVVRNKIPATQVQFASRTEALRAQLKLVSQDSNMLSAALHAQTQLLEVELTLALGNGEDINPLLIEMKDVMSKSDGLAGYPFEPFAKFVFEMGDILQRASAYDDLFEEIVAIAERRQSDTTTAEILVRRGTQQLDADRPYDAIATFGRALRKLYKQETRREAIRALYLCAKCYERIGLLWAARGTLIVAQSLAASDYSESGRVTRLHAACSNCLQWLELQLGRIPHALSWYRNYRGLRYLLSEQGNDFEGMEDEDGQFDLYLGQMLARTDPWELKLITQLPKALQNLGLVMGAEALLFVLGYDDQINLLAPDGSGEVLVPESIMRDMDKAIGLQLPERPTFSEGRMVSLESRTAGCQVLVTAMNTTACSRLAESILGALESFVSTSAATRMMAREPLLTIEISQSDLISKSFTWSIGDKAGRPYVEIIVRPILPTDSTKDAQSKTKATLAELTITLIGHAFMVDDSEVALQELICNERVFDRAIDFTGATISVEDLLGFQGTHISCWIDESLPAYPSRRMTPWESGAWRKQTEKAELKGPTFGNADITPETLAALLDRRSTKQSEIGTFSLIRDKLWNEAKWIGDGVPKHTGRQAAPSTCIGFCST